MIAIRHTPQGSNSLAGTKKKKKGRSGTVATSTHLVPREVSHRTTVVATEREVEEAAAFAIESFSVWRERVLSQHKRGGDESSTGPGESRAISKRLKAQADQNAKIVKVMKPYRVAMTAVMHEIRRVIMDTFSRFVATEAYLVHKDVAKINSSGAMKKELKGTETLFSGTSSSKETAWWVRRIKNPLTGPGQPTWLQPSKRAGKSSGYELFLAYCTTEFSQENVHFLNDAFDLQLMRETKTVEYLKGFIELYFLYMKDESPMMINISFKHRKRITTLYNELIMKGLTAVTNP